VLKDPADKGVNDQVGRREDGGFAEVRWRAFCEEFSTESDRQQQLPT
jgi:hypothetical protein